MCRSWTGKAQLHSVQTYAIALSWRPTPPPTPPGSPPWSSLVLSLAFGLGPFSQPSPALASVIPNPTSQHLGSFFSLTFCFWNLLPIPQLSPKLCFEGFMGDHNLYQSYCWFPVLSFSHLHLQVLRVLFPSGVIRSTDQRVVSVLFLFCFTQNLFLFW